MNKNDRIFRKSLDSWYIFILIYSFERKSVRIWRKTDEIFNPGFENCLRNVFDWKIFFIKNVFLLKHVLYWEMFFIEKLIPQSKTTEFQITNKKTAWNKWIRWWEFQKNLIRKQVFTCAKLACSLKNEGHQVYKFVGICSCFHNARHSVMNIFHIERCAMLNVTLPYTSTRLRVCACV